MNSFGNEERELLNESILNYFQDNYSFEHRRELVGSQSSATNTSFDRRHWQQFAQLGWTAIGIEERFGGAGGGITELGILMAASGRHLGLEPLLSTLVLGAGALQLADSPAQTDLLGSIVSGDLLLAFCHTEPDGGYDRATVNTLASRNDDHYTIRGSKIFSLHASIADQLILSARDDNGKLALFLAPAASAGISIVSAPSLDDRPGASIQLDGVQLPIAARLGSADQDMTAAVNDLLNRAALAVCAEAVGAMNEVTTQTVDYLKSREQFGQPLSKMQVLQHRLVDMSIACEESRCVVHAALQAHDRHDAEAQTLCWQAKAQTARAARYVGGQAIQLHGGMGMTDELAIGHYYKRLVMCETQFGDAQWYLSKLAAS